MPSKSPEQAKLMRAAAHNPAFAKKVAVPVKVAKEFVSADKRSGSNRAPEKPSRPPVRKAK